MMINSSVVLSEKKLKPFSNVQWEAVSHKSSENAIKRSGVKWLYQFDPGLPSLSQQHRGFPRPTHPSSGLPASRFFQKMTAIRK